MTLCLIDNYDSFSYNLYQMLGVRHPRIEVVRNDRTTVDAVAAAGFDGILLSPGPGRPEDSGVCMDIVRDLSGSVPIFGVCLGYQVICQHFGAAIVRAKVPVHGKASALEHDGRGLFSGLPQGMLVGRYHSLVVDPSTLPAVLEVSSRTQDGTVMSVRHREHPTLGVQFHPESILSPRGERLLSNFLDGLCREAA